MTAPRGVGVCPRVVWVPGCLGWGWPGHPQEVGALGLHPGVWSRHAGCCSQLLLLQLAVGGLPLPHSETPLSPSTRCVVWCLLPLVKARSPGYDPLLAFFRCRQGRKLGDVQKPQPGGPGSGLRVPLHLKSLCARGGGGTVPPTFPEHKAQRGRATCPRPQSKAGCGLPASH